MTIPKQLNHYTILESLGQGGMGEVFLAEDTRLHRRIAIKVLSGLTAWSFDGTRLAVARGPRSSDVVIVTAKAAR